MSEPFLFPDEIADILRKHDRTGAVIHFGICHEFTAGQINYGLYASGRLYMEKVTGRIVNRYSLALMIYEAIEKNLPAYIDDYQIH